MTSIRLPSEHINCQNFVQGKWIPATGAEEFVISPLTGQTIGLFHHSTSNDVDLAVTRAQEAFPKWKSTPIKERTQIMFKFRELLYERIEEISHLISSENGKTLGESKAGILKGIEVLEFALSIQNLDLGGRMEVSRGVFCEYRRRPLGVVASITPFNFPAMVPMWTIPIAITLGNCYVWKPSEKTPLTSMAIANCLKDAGLPDGVLTVVQGGAETVNALIDNKDVKAVGFVGSTKVAKIVYSRASQNGKRALCLGGAKNHIVLLPDADPAIAGQGIADSFTGCAGQRCMAASVLLAVGNVEAQIQKIKERAEATTLCDKMGAIITAEQVSFLNEAIDKALAEGATLLLDGRNQNPGGDFADGHWIGPTILDNVKPGSFAATVELFGPVMSIVRCQNITEAMAVENDNEYGNACSVFTSNGAMAEMIANMANAGMVGINIGVPVPREPFSFGGVNDSKFGHGDITGLHSLDFWSDVKKITTKWQMQSDANWMS